MRLTLCSAHQNSKGFSLLEVLVAFVVLTIAVVTIFQLFSINLRTVKKAEDYSKALIYARSVMDNAYALPEISDGEESFDFEGDFKAVRTIGLKSSDEKTKIEVYEITVTVTWPPSGKLEIKGLRTYREVE